MTPSLRGQRIGSAVLLGLVTLVSAGALIAITSWMGRDIGRLWESGESVRVAEELEVALLLYGRERRLLDVTGSSEHARAMREAESQVHHWLEQARGHVGGEAEALLMEEVRRKIEAYLTRARTGTGAPLPAGAHDPDLAVILELTERLVNLNVADARDRMEEAQAWDQRANILGILAVLVLLTGIGGVIWTERRLVYQPVDVIQRALVSFRLGAPWLPAPERGATELRDIARAFNEMVARLERQREAQVSFLAGVAHDLRNPLSVLQLATRGASAGELPPERAQQRLAMVERQVERLGRMVNDLLDTTRIEAGQLELHLGEHDLIELVRESVELHRPVSPLHTLELQVPEQPAPVRCDPTRISQVLNNLLSNAIKYSPEGGTVRIQVAPLEDGYRIAVTDSGVGIPSAEQESIFEPFRRSSSTRGVIPGVGLGLAVARKIVAAHGGSLEVQSEPGRGSTFYAKLPVAGGAAGPNRTP
ncbi:sensor histidine kinase [Archangium lipolyticum]|uniref:sensor histidine kinase n=1 Tax=Archangium lipolyticum TaxID=2970465 RepID=UPI00214A041D|nr:HAMP domain-containing sensor histidine kinase [Archangium lipolyticum]